MTNAYGLVGCHLENEKVNLITLNLMEGSRLILGIRPRKWMY